MKEITSQVARLASGSEGDTRRREALDKRLGDIEQRIQSLLTLTEMISMNENPFISGKEDNGEQEAPAQPEAARPEAAPPEPSLYDDDAAQADRVPSAPAPDAAPSPAAPAAPSRPAASHPNDAQAERSEAPSAEERPPETAAPAPPAPARPENRPTATPDEPRQDPRPSAADKWHAASSGRPLGSLIPVDEPTPTPDPQIHQDTADPAQRADDRLFTLEWASMLAKHLPRAEITDFLDRYVEAGWVDGRMANRVRALATGLAQCDPDHPDEAQLHELHVRSTVLLSHLDGAPMPAARAAEVLGRARDVTSGSWLA